jgi:hypothetical protein
MSFVPISLSSLGKKDERRSISFLQAESEIQKNEWVDIE